MAVSVVEEPAQIVEEPADAVINGKSFTVTTTNDIVLQFPSEEVTEYVNVPAAVGVTLSEPFIKFPGVGPDNPLPVNGCAVHVQDE